jgi:hypothetical protein
MRQRFALKLFDSIVVHDSLSPERETAVACATGLGVPYVARSRTVTRFREASCARRFHDARRDESQDSSRSCHEPWALARKGFDIADESIGIAVLKIPAGTVGVDCGAISKFSCDGYCSAFPQVRADLFEIARGLGEVRSHCRSLALNLAAENALRLLRRPLRCGLDVDLTHGVTYSGRVTISDWRIETRAIDRRAVMLPVIDVVKRMNE